MKLHFQTNPRFGSVYKIKILHGPLLEPGFPDFRTYDLPLAYLPENILPSYNIKRSILAIRREY